MKWECLASVAQCSAAADSEYLTLTEEPGGDVLSASHVVTVLLKV